MGGARLLFEGQKLDQSREIIEQRFNLHSGIRQRYVRGIYIS